MTMTSKVKQFFSLHTQDGSKNLRKPTPAYFGKFPENTTYDMVLVKQENI